MKYVIDEEELKDLKNPIMWKYVCAFLKSKQPIEEIASGVFKEFEDQYGIYNEEKDTWTDIDNWVGELKANKLGKSITIYIQEVK